MSSNIKIFDTIEELSRSMVRLLEQTASEAIAQRGRFVIALAGGNTPRSVYSEWALSRKTNWSKVHFFWSDERCVLSTHPDSNFRMAFEVLLSKIPVPQSNIHRIPAEEDPMLASQQYEDEIREFFGTRASEPPAFDMILLGMGDDGHTASLFPETDAVHVTDSWVADNFVKKLNAHRITFTFPLINRAHRVVFTVTGSSKSAILAEVIQEAESCGFPAARVKPLNGVVMWYMDKPASGKLG